MDVLALQLRATEWEEVVPVPESEAVAGELVALLTTERLPVTLPVVVGANVTLKVAF